MNAKYSDIVRNNRKSCKTIDVKIGKLDYSKLSQGLLDINTTIIENDNNIIVNLFISYEDYKRNMIKQLPSTPQEMVNMFYRIIT